MDTEMLAVAACIGLSIGYLIYAHLIGFLRPEQGGCGTGSCGKSCGQKTMDLERADRISLPRV